MAFQMVTTARGPSALWAGKQLASAYSPDREAEAWANRLKAPPGSLVFVAGDPWGLAAGALNSSQRKGIALVPGPVALAHVPKGVRAWAPESGLETFLEAVLDEEGPEGVVWEVWPAFERLAPEVSLDWSRRFRDVFRAFQGSWLTHRRFGRRFWINSLRNLLDWDRPVELVPGSRPVVIAASGPSLDDGLERLARDRHRFDLWALPSSFETLVQRGLVPDAGVATDGGFYAREHLQRLAGTSVPILAAVSSASDPQLASRPSLLFSQGMPVERALLSSLLPRVPEVPSQGTVAVTALRLALEATTGPVLIAGLDLSFRNLRGHTSPHTVDRRIAPLQDRLRPLEGLWAQRWAEQATVSAEGVRTAPALLTYAGWFRSRARFSRTVYRVAPSALRWGSMDEVGWDEAADLWRDGARDAAVRFAPATGWPPREKRRVRLRQALDTLWNQAKAADEPWLREVCRTAVPDEWLEDLRTRRAGGTGTRAVPALLSFLDTLRQGLD